ncbi:hypothetical protein [Amphritea balenae]|uniref:Uncharacterized protein n=1 Tax=Amphritea balenae TaxID=452629 RepID=A0A3P1SLF0_9GAMM|nr:hypothetical protein [Amphritea balenae]RRC98071.1 hypothetical protein EHS89_15985 [Amphritea balenae]GGK67336.1 hypothetical protein GCM10007941_16770 [Amphritea balenae]
MIEDYKLILVVLFIIIVFAPVTWQAIQRRKLNPPPMASSDRKLFRLWRSDPKAYERQYGEMDRQYAEAQQKKSRKTDQ